MLTTSGLLTRTTSNNTDFLNVILGKLEPWVECCYEETEIDNWQSDWKEK